MRQSPERSIAVLPTAIPPPRQRNIEQWRFAMRNSTQLRWIEHAEAKSVLEHAGLRRAVSEPHVNIACATTRPAWLDWLRELTRKRGRTVAAVRSLLVNSKISVKVASRAALRLSPTEVDYDRVLVAVLITDIVDSTKWAAGVGDRNWRVLLGRHHHATRYQIKRFGGREVGNRGDGFVGIFDSPSRAVRCASAIADTIAPLGISLRSGIHAGEVHLKGGEISGIAVHIAARIAATAHPGEACVSKTVRDLVVGSGLVFEDRGIHRLRGLPEEIHLYAMQEIGDVANASIINLEPDARISSHHTRTPRASRLHAMVETTTG
jgi:class 3 adenylate cyclase